MKIITEAVAKNVLKNMKKFHDEQVRCHSEYGMNFLDNLGRRNVIMSQAQEFFLANALMDNFPDVKNDGRPGQPDILIPSIEKEIECKLTSACVNGSINFQTDYETLRKKKNIDYVYIIADKFFESFAFLYFEKLSIDDFRVPSPGSRGKSQMIKHVGMKKCSMFIGDVKIKNLFEIEKLVKRKEKETNKIYNRLSDLLSRVYDINNVLVSRKSQPKELKKKKTLKTINREWKLFTIRNRKIDIKIDYWNSVPKKYSFILEKIQ